MFWIKYQKENIRTEQNERKLGQIWDASLIGDFFVKFISLLIIKVMQKKTIEMKRRKSTLKERLSTQFIQK